ncbi:hypothetical protein C0J29_14535 [Mycobacterium paragordonae]|nr:hypothetical protein C0J29_14535 [Mycobacterium paragordonae]
MCGSCKFHSLGTFFNANACDLHGFDYSSFVRDGDVRGVVLGHNSVEVPLLAVDPGGFGFDFDCLVVPSGARANHRRIDRYPHR